MMLSDAHLTGLDDPNQYALVQWLDRVQVPRLFLLGDVFHHWWGHAAVVQSRYVPVCAALLRLVQRGTRLHVVPGNHDFALGDFFSKTLGATITGPTVVTLGGRRFLLAHGDESDRRWGYRVTRRVLRSNGFAALVRTMGAAQSEKLLQRLAGTSRDHMETSERLIALQRRWAREQLQAHRAEVAVMGHSHHLETVRLPEGEIVHLGAWQGHRSYLTVDGAGRFMLQQAL